MNFLLSIYILDMEPVLQSQYHDYAISLIQKEKKNSNPNPTKKK